MIFSTPQRGFTLLIAVVLTSVALGIGLALLDIAYKQVVLASTAKQSQSAFYAADTLMECVLYYDQQLNTFAYSATSGSVTCNGQTASVTFDQTNTSLGHKRTFTLPCTGAGTERGKATIYKTSAAATQIFVTGYNTCTANNPRRIERGLKAFY